MAAIYIACALDAADTARSHATRLRRDGHDVVSTWHDSIGVGAVDPHLPATRKSVLASNLLDMSLANAVLVDTRRGSPCATFGEVAWAIAHGTRVIWIQPPGRRADGVRYSNIWDAHSLVSVVHDELNADNAIDQLIGDCLCAE